MSVSSKITQSELETYLWGSAVLLRDHVDAGSYKHYIFPLLFFKRLNDVYDEETATAVRENGPEAADWEETHSFLLFSKFFAECGKGHHRRIPVI